MLKTAKHVIFLGAGASVTSGYPLADELRKDWLVSGDNLRAKLETEIGDDPEIFLTTPVTRFNKWIQSAESALNLFRQGGFGTIDEFCYLIRNERPEEVRALKEVLRFVFGLRHPEIDFHKSDYYGFIQKIFEPEDLTSLKKDIVVLSFNYDPYLEWLLRRAYQTRVTAANKSRERSLLFDNNTDASITSGLSGGASGLKSLHEGDSFCLLKLHGSAAWPNSAANEHHSNFSPHCSHADFFHQKLQRRFEAITNHGEVPILFPWEVFAEDGHFLSPEKFSLRDEIHSHQDIVFRHGGRQPDDPSLHEVFKTIWKRARLEIQAADRISFVGLSMGEYLNWGLKYLFQGKQNKIKLTITDRDSMSRGAHGPFEPRSPVSRIFAMRDKFCPEMQFGPPAIRANFAEFITKDI